MKYKVGDRVRIKSLDWYKENMNEYGHINCGYAQFIPDMAAYCGEVLTICKVEEDVLYYHMKECQYVFMDEMIEGLVEEETQSKEMLKENAKHYWKLINGDSKSKFKVGDKVTLDLYPCVVTAVEWRGDSKYVGYVYTVRGTDFGKKVKETDLVFRDVEEETKPKYEDEVTGEYYSTPKYLVRPNGYQFVDENGNVINATKIVLEKKKKEYPKTYEECCEIIHSDPKFYVDTHLYSGTLEALYKLLICRNAYWKLYGEEMGLGKPWEPQDTNTFSIFYDRLACEIEKQDGYCGANSTLEFPTEEMRDAFYENFKSEIEICKELL